MHRHLYCQAQGPGLRFSLLCGCCQQVCPQKIEDECHIIHIVFFPFLTAYCVPFTPMFARTLTSRISAAAPAPRRLISSTKSRLGGDHGHAHTVFDVTPEHGYSGGVPCTCLPVRCPCLFVCLSALCAPPILVLFYVYISAYAFPPSAHASSAWRLSRAVSIDFGSSLAALLRWSRAKFCSCFASLL
jgi:hypothetical protein